ncbi:NNMT [Branchiostoma lanceolatum]|uniref:NNMT protein n=1 Tax=Branchiostoma lanceolatum TaxID=7740 RepID=A0A8K0F043_BRALA|nr:NNMT [Branchiostoma lanceolatum]
MAWLLEKVADTFAGGDVPGDRLLDVGTRPAIHNLISPARCFRSITCAEFCQANRVEVEKWVRDDGDAFDWDPIIKYVCKLEGTGNWKERKEALRNAIEAVVFCDVREKNPLGALTSDPYDVVSSVFTLCGVAKDRPDFSAVVSNVASLVKPGGTMVLVCDFGVTYYTDGTSTYPHCVLDAPYVKQVVEENGFGDVKDDVFLYTTPCPHSDAKGLVYVTARKLEE